VTQTVEMSSRECVKCGTSYIPKPGGHNAKYCSKNCKLRSKPYKSRAGKETFYSRVTKSDPEKLARHMERARVNKAELRRWLAEYKMSRGCIDCGFAEHPAALQFDHTGPKTAAISEIRSSRKRILDEIENGRCVIRCANCHSVKTWRDKVGR
jgi:hypothetical protein